VVGVPERCADEIFLVWRVARPHQPSGSGSKCKDSPSNAAIIQLTVTASLAFLNLAISAPLTPALPPFNYEAKVEGIGVLPADAETDRINDAGTG
jgi:hypothetical protein